MEIQDVGILIFFLFLMQITAYYTTLKYLEEREEEARKELKMKGIHQLRKEQKEIMEKLPHLPLTKKERSDLKHAIRIAKIAITIQKGKQVFTNKISIEIQILEEQIKKAQKLLKEDKESKR